MDKQVWDLDFCYEGPQSVRVSCHAGDFGSNALCNIVGDQPLFYIDDVDTEDDLAMFEEDQAMSYGLSASDEKFLAKMRQKIESYDKAAKSLSQFDITSVDKELDEFINTSSEKLTLERVLDYGCQSGIFKSYCDFISEKSITIELSETTTTSDYNSQKNMITLNPHMAMIDATTALIKSMRMAWHDKGGVLLNPLAFLPEEAVLLNRLKYADLDITKISYWWDLKLAGCNDIWARAMCGSDYDLCSAYAMEAMTDFRSIKSGLAARATFEKWFISARCKNIDRGIIQIMMGGHTDIEINNQDASRVIAMDVIIGMGRIVGGNNYLSPIAAQIMNDAMYMEVRDRSNANFLWFVSFERRMSQMEQELQGGEQKDETKTQNNHDNVISLPQGDTHNEHNESDNTYGASLYFLDHFRGF